MVADLGSNSSDPSIEPSTAVPYACLQNLLPSQSREINFGFLRSCTSNITDGTSGVVFLSFVGGELGGAEILNVCNRLNLQ